MYPSDGDSKERIAAARSYRDECLRQAEADREAYEAQPESDLAARLSRESDQRLQVAEANLTSAAARPMTAIVTVMPSTGRVTNVQWVYGGTEEVRASLSSSERQYVEVYSQEEYDRRFPDGVTDR